MDPGTWISIAEIAFRSTVFTVKAFRKGLNFGNDAERLVLKLEIERIRLQLWGENSGLVPLEEGGKPSLPARLEPVGDVLKAQLETIQGLFREQARFSSRYGLERTEEAPTSSASLNTLVMRMQKTLSLHHRPSPSMASLEKDPPLPLAGRKRKAEEAAAEEEDSEDGLDLGVDNDGVRYTTSMWKKMRWSIQDLKKFETLVSDLEGHITRLNQLLTEAQQRRVHEDDVRVRIVVVGSAIDRRSLGLIREAVASEPATNPLRAGVERKAVSYIPLIPPRESREAKRARILNIYSGENAGRGVSAGPAAETEAVGFTVQSKALALSQFDLPPLFGSLARFLARPIQVSSDDESGRRQEDFILLFERKNFPLYTCDFDRAKIGVQRLVMLLAKPKPPGFLTPKAEGCITDREHECWWFVFRLPTEPLALSPALAVTQRQPVSLRFLLDPASQFRPPLEHRYDLAASLCSTFSELYTSNWLHKGIRSENVVFPVLMLSSAPFAAAGGPAEILRSPLVCGFDYSRMEGDPSIDYRVKVVEESYPVQRAMYRHPSYQRDATDRYRLVFDLYSLGLVLWEIGTWSPLSNLFDAEHDTPGESLLGLLHDTHRESLIGLLHERRDEAEVSFSNDEMSFARSHAWVLKSRVTKQVDAELAFRTGTPYYEAVKFCLGAADDEGKQNDQDWELALDYVPVHPAMEFYDKVVVPLSRLAAANPVSPQVGW